MEQKDTYTLEELYDNLPIALSELGRRSGINEVTLARIRDGYFARRSTVVRLLGAFSKVHGVKLTLENVSGILIRDKKAMQGTEKAKEAPAKPAKVIPEKPPKRPYKPRKTDLPEGCVLATDFARMHGVNERRFYDHMIIGLGPGTVPGELSDPTIPVKEQVDYSERDKPGRKGERERYLTPEQQEKALEFWKRHGVPFTEAKQEEGLPR
jgi:hypothetical protein